ncbi:MAG TPA: BlaI/MecI/CopY family transcriptional regulator [Phycisphaerae bacterium]|nr:BlaI/MecI/CopY family transcriptional regulator [Phycisphaerae bacterium]
MALLNSSGTHLRQTMSEREYDLGAAELEVLKALWDEGPATVREVLNHLHTRGRHVAYTTVLTTLSRLEQKGFVTSDKSGLAYVYRAKVTRQRFSRSRVKALVRQLYDGAAGPVVLELIRTEQLTSDEIGELHRLIERLDSKSARKRT